MAIYFDVNARLARFDQLQQEINIETQQAANEATSAKLRLPNEPYAGVPHASNLFSLHEKVWRVAEEILREASPSLTHEQQKKLNTTIRVSKEHLSNNF